MPTVCAIFTHFASESNTLTCLDRLAAQTRRPEHIVIINNASASDPSLEKIRAHAQELFAPNCVSILQMERNVGNAGGCAHGMKHAFSQLNADFVWVLDDDSWARPESLASLLNTEVDKDTIRMSMVIDPQKDDELSWPLTARSEEETRWRHIGKREELPDTDEIISRGGWLGALYPRQAWEKVGEPTEELFIRGEDEEYPWKLRHAGFHFITLRNSPLEHPSSRRELIEYRIGQRSFFYEPGLHPSRSYYKNRNWAWLQRLRYPKSTLRRLAACGVYIIFSLCAMIQTNELSITRVYQLFRALHYGFYGNLKPYA